MKKETVIKVLESFEDDIAIGKLIEKLLFVEKIEKGVKDVDTGKLLNFEETTRRFTSKYNPVFVAKIKESREQVKNGDTRVVDIDEL